MAPITLPVISNYVISWCTILNLDINEHSAAAPTRPEEKNTEKSTHTHTLLQLWSFFVLSADRPAAGVNRGEKLLNTPSIQGAEKYIFMKTTRYQVLLLPAGTVVHLV